MREAPAGPLEGAARPRPGGWLPTPLTLIGAVARVHTAPARWSQPVADAMAGWRIGAAAAGPAPGWVGSPAAWRYLLRYVADAYGPDHVPVGHLDLKADHARRAVDGRLLVIDAETLRPDLTGLPDLVTLAHLLGEVGCPRTPRWVRHTYLAHTSRLGAHWADLDLVAACEAFAAATGLRSLHGVAD